MTHLVEVSRHEQFFVEINKVPTYLTYFHVREDRGGCVAVCVCALQISRTLTLLPEGTRGLEIGKTGC